MEYSTIIYEKKDRIAKVTLNRPEVLNALNTALRGELCLALDEIEKDDEVGVFILTGAGRAFCAGVDLKEILQEKERKHMEMWEKTRNLSIPTICAVNGYAITGGWELAIACDIIVASENAMFADTHARVGIIPGAGMSQILPRLIGPNKAKEFSFTGNYLPAQEALQLGLVNRLVPPDKLQSVVEGIARDILSCDQKVLRKIKYLINEGVKTTLERGMTLETLEYLRWRHSQSLLPEEAEQRKKQLLERGRAQSKKETSS